MAHKMLDGATAVGASSAIKVGEAITHHSVLASFQHGITPITALSVILQGAMKNDKADNGLITPSILAVGSTAERVTNGAFAYRIAGVNYVKGAVAVGTALPAGYTLTNTYYGAINIYINAASTITYGFPATVQAYASAALAVAAAKLVTMDAGGIPITNLCYIGRVVLYNNTGSVWDSLTDDLTTGGADITNAVFTDDNVDFVDMTTHVFSAQELLDQQALFHVVDVGMKYIRTRVSVLTGTGSVDIYYSPIGGI